MECDLGKEDREGVVRHGDGSRVNWGPFFNLTDLQPPSYLGMFRYQSNLLFHEFCSYAHKRVSNRNHPLRAFPFIRQRHCPPAVILRPCRRIVLLQCGAGQSIAQGFMRVHPISRRPGVS